MQDFINDFRTIHQSLRAALSNDRGEYTINFVQEPNGRWYIDMPWDDDRAYLQMVSGTDDFLSDIDPYHHHKVTLHVVPSDHPLTEDENPGIAGHFELRRLDESLRGGAHYDASAWFGDEHAEMWVCPVTLCVFGCYPEYLYFKNVSETLEADYQAGLARELGLVVGLSANELFFYDTMKAGDIFETSGRYNIEDHVNLTEKAWKVIPDFMRDELPKFCDLYFNIRAQDNIERKGTWEDDYAEAIMLNNYLLEHRDSPYAEDFTAVYCEYVKDTCDVIVLPRSRKVVLLQNLKIDDILKVG